MTKLFQAKNIEKIYLYIIVMAILFLDRKSLYVTVILGYEKAFLIFVLLMIPLFLVMIFKDKLNKKMIVAIGIYIILMMIPSFIKLDFQGFYLSSITYIMCVFLIVSNYSIKQVIRVLNNCILLISSYSIFIYFIIAPLLKIVNLAIPTIVNSVGFQLYNYVLCFFPVVGSSRNYGLYSEPGIFQIYILLALIISMYTNVKHKNIKVIVLSIAMITTGSIAGIIVWGMVMSLLIPKLFIELKKSTKKQVLKYIMVVTLILISLVVIGIKNGDKIMNEVNSMKDKLTQKDNMSNISRMQSITVVTKEFLISPLYGTEFLKVMSIVDYGNTNTITSTFATFGILFGIVNVTLIYIFVKVFRKNKITTIIIFAAIITSLFNEFIFGTLIYTLIVMIGLKSYVLKEDIKNENTLAS